MANLNIVEWSPGQVADWLRGLNGVVAPYVSLFLDKCVNGQKLLTLRSDDLDSLGVYVIGHQELLLEAIEHLRNFHFELQRENLQLLAMRLSCVATSLYNELRLHQDGSKVETQTLSDVAHVIAAVKPLVCWLNRSPFLEQPEFSERKSALLKLSLEAATFAQRDRFAEHPTQAIGIICCQLAALADYVIQDVADPMVLQPACLESVVLRQKDSWLGFDIVPSFSGHHQVARIKFGSPAHASGKIEEGDEIVQVNNQTVIGWREELARQACLTPSGGGELALTLRRRPGARASVLATPQLRTFRPHRRPQAGLLHTQPTRIRPWDKRDVLALSRFMAPVEERAVEPAEVASSSDESDVLSPPGSPGALTAEAQRLYMPKPRSQLQRRNTTSGGSPVSRRPPVSIQQFWQELKNHKSLNHTGSAQMEPELLSGQLYRRDKAISCSTGLELSPRPRTCLGVGIHRTLGPIQANLISENAVNGSSKADPAKNRGKLDKSHSTPAYDFNISGTEEPGSLVTQIIPESPTTPSDSPTIVVHSAEKADQILDFKKSSSEIGVAIMQQQNKQRDTADVDIRRENTKFCFPERATDPNNDFEVDKVNNSPESKVDQILETINIAMMEHKNKDSDKRVITKQSSFKSQSVFYTESGEKSTKTFTLNEHVHTIQNEMVQAINEQRLITTTKITRTKQMLSDVPPEPPPRPPGTHRLGCIPKEVLIPIKDNRIKDYPPLKPVKNQESSEQKDYPPLKPIKHMDSNLHMPLKHISKHDIQVIPNVDMATGRKEVQLPLNSEAKSLNLSQADLSMGFSPTSLEKRNNPLNIMSNPDLTSTSLNLSPDLSKSSLSETGSVQSGSLQRLEGLGMGGSRIQSPRVLSPGGGMRSMFPTSKSKSLKKKNSILAKRRKVSVKDLGPGELQGALFQRCRTKSNSIVVWDRKWYVLQANTLYGFKTKDTSKADCLIFLNGFTVSAAQEVKSKPFAFKVYHTGTVFYFAADSAESMNTWYEYISRATMLNYDSWERAHKKDKKVDESKHFSETDYSDNDFSSDKETSDKGKSEGKEKDKSKFGSLKKFTNRIHKTESHENVNHSSTSLDRKYLRFFSSKQKHKEDKSKTKNSDTPVPTEQYRSYRKIPTSSQQLAISIQQSASFTRIPQELKDEVSDKITHNGSKSKHLVVIDDSTKNDPRSSEAQIKPQKKLPKPINYIHASNPNLLDFEKSDFVAKPAHNVLVQKSEVQRPENLKGFVTLKQFMLEKQEEERREVYSNRVLMGIERDSRKEDKASSSKKAAKELQKQWEKIIPDVIYGELPTYNDDLSPTTVEQIQNRTLPKTPDKQKDLPKNHEYVHIPDDTVDKAQNNTNTNSKPISVKGKDGYEKIVYSASTNDIVLNDDYRQDSELIPPKILPRKPSLAVPEDFHSRTSSDIVRKCSASSAKDLGYEVIYGDELTHKRSDSLRSEFLSTDPQTMVKSMSTSSSRDLGYETVYGTEKSSDSLSKKSSNASNLCYLVDDTKLPPRRKSEDLKKPVPPPKLLPKSKQVLNRQNSLTSTGNRNSGPDMNPVFVQGESPEKFWLNSLRRNDKVHTIKNTEVKGEKFYSKKCEPGIASSEAHIVRRDSSGGVRPVAEQGTDEKTLKSATQYTPMCLPLTPSSALKTSPQFEMNLDTKESSSGAILRLRQMFQQGSSGGGGGPVAQTASTAPSPTRARTLLGSPRLHRALFRKAPAPPDQRALNFTYSKGPAPPVSEGSDRPPEGEELSPLRHLATPDYPHLQYPPTFEPESYSLADPAGSLNYQWKKTSPDEK